MDEQQKNHEPQTAPPEEKKVGLFRRIGEKISSAKTAIVTAFHERTGELQHAKAKRIGVLIGVALFAIAFIVFYLTVGRMIVAFIEDADSFKKWIEGFNEWSIVVFLILRVIQTVLKLIPGGALEIAAGFIFGTWWGFVWCMVGSLIGSLIIILLGKKYGLKLVGLFVSPEKLHSVSFLKDRETMNFAYFLMYFLPGTPKDIFTWVASIADDGNLFSFMVVSMVARMPSVIASTWCGAALMDENYLLSVFIFGGIILLGVVGGWIYKKVNGKHKKAVEERENAARTEQDASDEKEK